VAAGAITAYDPGYDHDGRVARTAIDVPIALSSAGVAALAGVTPALAAGSIAGEIREWSRLSPCPATQPSGNGGQR
jgi:hypothetical protein